MRDFTSSRYSNILTNGVLTLLLCFAYAAADRYEIIRGKDGQQLGIGTQSLRPANPYRKFVNTLSCSPESKVKDVLHLLLRLYLVHPVVGATAITDSHMNDMEKNATKRLGAGNDITTPNIKFADCMIATIAANFMFNDWGTIGARPPKQYGDETPLEA